MTHAIETFFTQKRKRIEQLLTKYCDAPTTYPQRLHEAMVYSVSSGGKRLRPLLVLLGNHVAHGKEQDAYPAAVAVELVHTYSLVHDDLPALDNDDYRRGKLTCHKKFDEPTAILVGDALLTKAFEVLGATRDAHVLQQLLAEFSRAIGSKGMVGGQMVDILSEGKKRSKKDAAHTLTYIHHTKTAALIEASIGMGALTAKASPKIIAALRTYGNALGLLFQITDDILDVVGDKKKLGKQGSDTRNQKLTYHSLYGLDGARAAAEQCVVQGKQALRGLGREGKLLDELLMYVLKRSY